MKLRWTVILFIVNALLLWGIITQLGNPPAERAFSGQTRLFLPLSKNDWDGIGVKSATTGWKVNKDRWGRWWIRSPYEWPARAGVVSRMSGTLATLAVDSSFAVEELGRVGQTLKSYGLDNPRAVLEISSGSRTLLYKIGDATPLGNKIYVMSADEKEVWVVDGVLNEYLNLTAAQIKQEGFFPFELIELEAVELEQGGVSRRLERKTGSNLWQLKLADGSLELKPGAWENWLVRLSNTPTVEAGAANVVQVLKTPTGRLNFQTLYGRRSLLLGDLDKTGGKRSVQWEGENNAFWVRADAVSAQNLEEFLETRPVPLNPSDISSLDWTKGEKNLSLRKLESGKWVLLNKENTPADAAAVELLLEKLCAVEGKPSLTVPGVVVAETLRLQTPKQVVELKIAASEPKIIILALGGKLSYEVAEWESIPAEENLIDRTVFEWSEGRDLSFVLTKRLAKKVGVAAEAVEPAESVAPTVVEYAAKSPPAEALRSLLHGGLKAEKFLTTMPEKENILLTAELVITPIDVQKDSVSDKTVSPLTLVLAKTATGWVVQYAQKNFEPERNFADFLDLLIEL